MTDYHDAAFASIDKWGLTKLEYFTASALQGLCANEKFRFDLDYFKPGEKSKIVSKMSVEIAIQTIKQLNEKQ